MKAMSAVDKDWAAVMRVIAAVSTLCCSAVSRTFAGGREYVDQSDILFRRYRLDRLHRKAEDGAQGLGGVDDVKRLQVAA